MNATRIASTARHLIDGFDTTAHRAIDAWLDGSERLGAAARQRWDTAFEESRAQLSAETRKNAKHAQQVFGGYYTRGTELAASGAAVAVDTLVQVARGAVDRAATWPGTRA